MGTTSVYWGWNFDAPLQIDMLSGVSAAVLRCDQDRMRNNTDLFQKIETLTVPVRVLHKWGLMCYSVSPKGAQALLNNCLPLRAQSIDIPGLRQAFKTNSLDATLNASHHARESFVCIPPLVIAENRHELSTILR
jgi:hypothetical protein